MIQEDYCSYEVAKLLKEKGFNETSNTIGTYNDKGEFYLYRHEKGYNHNQLHAWYSAPTLQMACKWLREIHNTFIEISWGQYSLLYLVTIKQAQRDFIPFPGCFDSFEEATEAALKHCLENLI